MLQLGWPWLVIVGLLLVMAGAGIYAVIRVGGRTAARMQTGRMQLSSMRNLETIAAALNAYASDHGRYPPPILRDDSGKALHSWRVLILPYLGEEDLYDQFDLNVAWDEGVNQGLVYQDFPAAYRHPGLTGWGF
ncbi:MAG: DUF1559 domain-containing protein, partial [Planctomycetota bacterium]